MYLLLLPLLFLTNVNAACLVDSTIERKNVINDVAKIEAAVEDFQHLINRELKPPLRLTITLEHLNPRVNAEIIKEKNDLLIKVLGGMINHEKMNVETLQLLLCHEAGHFFGGPPLKARNGWSSTEGQSDYYSGVKCAHLLGFDEATFIDASLALTSIYAEIGRESAPRIDSCDETVVARTNFGYPKAQCRFDTLLAGWRGMERPSCWFNGL